MTKRGADLALNWEAVSCSEGQCNTSGAEALILIGGSGTAEAVPFPSSSLTKSNTSFHEVEYER
jgi:hypothetical protein